MTGVERQKDFRTQLEWAARATDEQERLEKLATLAASNPTYVETIQIHNLLCRVSPPEHGPYTRVRLAFLGSSTRDHLVPAIRVASLRRGLLIECFVGQFGQYRQELMSEDSALVAFEPEIVLLSLACAEFSARVPLTADKDEAAHALGEIIGDLRDLWRTARERFGAAVIQQTFMDVNVPLFGSHDALIPGAPGRVVSRLNGELADAAAEDSVLLLDVARASARDGMDTWFDTTRWLHGRIEIAPSAAGRYGELLARLVGAQMGRSKKCLVLDLDNTLWGGVIGEDGLEGLILGEGSALGEAHLALQKYAKQLKERGIVLAICSKNEWSIASEVFDRHPEMALERSDIASFAVNWNDKAENLRAIAKQLNLGLDTFVFVDDSPVERARVREALPMVAVPELPDDPAHYVHAIAEAGYFEAISLTDDDRQRTSHYLANAQRQETRGAAQSLDEFLCGLSMSVAYGPITEVHKPRACQLINKTNQFNTTTRRMTNEEFARFVSAPRNMTLQFRLSDRFGENGLVSVMLFRPGPDGDDTLELFNWVMSCRVFGRQLEGEAMNIAVEIASRKGVRAFVADYIPSPKNLVIGDLFAALGFASIPRDARCDNASRWLLELAAYTPRATHIRRETSG